MKRTGIFALAAGCAIGVTALVGGVGYASALDVAEQAGRTLDVSGVSTVDSTSKQLADSTEIEATAEPTDDATDDSAAGDATTDDDGTADQGSGDAVDVVDPSDPVVIKEDGDKNCRSDNAAERIKRAADHLAWLAAQKAAEDAAGDDSGTGSGDDGWNHDGDHDGWNHEGDDRRGDDRGGDWGGRDGDRSGSWGGGHHGGGGGGHH